VPVPSALDRRTARLFTTYLSTHPRQFRHEVADRERRPL